MSNLYTDYVSDFQQAQGAKSTAALRKSRGPKINVPAHYDVLNKDLGALLFGAILRSHTSCRLSS